MALCWTILDGLAQTSPQTWSLQDCIDYALQNNLQLRQNALNNRVTANNLLQSRAERLPNLNASAGQSYNAGRSIDPFTNQFTTDVIRSNNFSVSMSIPVFTGFRIKNTITQNQVLLQAGEQDLAQAQNDLQLNIAGAYLNILLNRELVKNAELQRQNTDTQIERLRKLIAAGVLPEIDLYDLLAQAATNDQQIVSSRNALMLSELSLKQLLQLPAQDSINIQTPVLSDPVLGSPALPQLVYEQAETTQPNIKSADLNTEAARLGVEIAQSNRYPSISINGVAFTGYSSAQSQFFEGDGTTQSVFLPIGFLADDPSRIVLTEREIPNGEVIDFTFGRQLKEAFRQNVGVTVQIPIFNRFQVDNAVKNAKINVERAQLNAQLTRNQLRQTIEQAYADVLAAQATYAATQERIRALETSLEAIEKRLQAGTANSIDFTLAQNQLNAARTDQLRAKYETIFRQKVLDFYQGKELSLD